MTTPSLSCRVQALYPFESSDPSSLKFEEGDIIDVLAKLPSGWWDGWCNGIRGWFPSNFVKVIEDYGSTVSSPTSQGHKRMSGMTDLFDDRVGGHSTHDRRTSLPPNWSIQDKEDGTASYYFNTLTGEMRSTYPYDDTFYDVESDEDSITSTIDSNPRSESVIDGSYMASNESVNVSDASKDVQSSKWIQRTTPQGLPFFYNMSTHETAWHADSQDQPKSNRNSTFSQNSILSFDSQETLSWNKLSLNVTLTINNLLESTRYSQRALYKKHAAKVVEAVRFMLVASGTISKDSLHIKTNGVLRSHHRAMMASMSKLVLSSQLCADGAVTDVSKLLSDGNELLLAVRNFIHTCESLPVQVSHVDPILFDAKEDIKGRNNSISSSTGGSSILDQGMRAKYQLQSDLVENLDAYGASMQESMESLMANLNRHSDSRCSLAVLLFTQFRNFGNQNGQFLSIIEDIDFESVKNSPKMQDLTIAKQKLYDGLGLLFFKMQTMTDESIPMDKVTTEMSQVAQSIIDAIKMVCDNMAGLVIEAANTKDTSLSPDFLKETTAASSPPSSNNMSPFLDFDFDSSPPLKDLSDNRRSHSVDTISTTTSGQQQRKEMTTSTSKLSNRSSAPISDSISIDTSSPYKHRSHTLSEAQSKHTSAKLKQFFGDDPSTAPTSPTDGNTTTASTTTTNAAAVAAGGATTPTSLARKPTLTTAASSINTGTSTPTTTAAPTVVGEEEHSYLQYDYSPNEIVFTVDGSVKGGTLPALVERMTLHDYLDMNFNNTFLLTYRSFCTSMELLELLEGRYNIQPPAELTPEELEIWVTKKQKLIRLRVFNVLKIWLEQYYYEEDSVILDRLLFFTNTRIKDTLSFSAYQLERLIHKRKEACKDLKKLVITQQFDAPDPILPRNLKKFRLLDLDPTEMARQLTIMDFKLYSSIKPVECLDKGWSRDASNTSDSAPIATNIRASIDYCNQVTTWVSDEILSQSEVKKRSTLIKYWVNVAEKCRVLNNFNTCMAVLSAFDNSAVGRLKRTWEMVGARTNHILSNIRKLMGANRNFNQYRALIHSINPPCIPFLGIYLQDLTFIEDGNPNFLKTSKDLINFAKRAKTAEVIREIQQYQSMGYQFRTVDEIQSFILMNLHSSRDEDQLYKESLKLEPKERDDEKITRLLQESGFL